MTGVQTCALPISDLISGQVDFSMDSLVQLLPLIKSGKLKALAVLGAKRSSLLPQVPTIAESGVPGYEFTNWFGLVAPSQTPGPILQKIHADVSKVLQSPELRAELEALVAGGALSGPVSLDIAAQVINPSLVTGANRSQHFAERKIRLPTKLDALVETLVVADEDASLVALPHQVDGLAHGSVRVEDEGCLQRQRRQASHQHGILRADSPRLDVETGEVEAALLAQIFAGQVVVVARRAAHSGPLAAVVVLAQPRRQVDGLLGKLVGEVLDDVVAREQAEIGRAHV